MCETEEALETINCRFDVDFGMLLMWLCKTRNRDGRIQGNTHFLSVVGLCRGRYFSTT